MRALIKKPQMAAFYHPDEWEGAKRAHITFPVLCFTVMCRSALTVQFTWLLWFRDWWQVTVNEWQCSSRTGEQCELSSTKWSARYLWHLWQISLLFLSDHQWYHIFPFFVFSKILFLFYLLLTNCKFLPKQTKTGVHFFAFQTFEQLIFFLQL